MNKWKIIKKIFLKHLGKYQLRLGRDIYMSVLEGSGAVFSHQEFASVIEGDENSFMITGKRNHNCSDISKKEIWDNF